MDLLAQHIRRSSLLGWNHLHGPSWAFSSAHGSLLSLSLKFQRTGIALVFGQLNLNSLLIFAIRIALSSLKYPDSRYGSASLFVSFLHCAMDLLFSSNLCNSTQPILQRKVSSLHPCALVWFFYFWFLEFMCALDALLHFFFIVLYLCRQVLFAIADAECEVSERAWSSCGCSAESLSSMRWCNCSVLFSLVLLLFSVWVLWWNSSLRMWATNKRLLYGCMMTVTIRFLLWECLWKQPPEGQSIQFILVFRWIHVLIIGRWNRHFYRLMDRF